MWTCMNRDRHAAFSHASNCITICSELVHMAEVLNIVYDRSSKSKRSSPMKNGEEVGLFIQKLVNWSFCRILLAQSTGMWVVYVSHRSDNICSGGSEIDRPWRVWMQMITPRNDIFGVNNDCMYLCIQLLSIQWLCVCLSGEHQWSVNDF